jgi:hypothetical protein
MKKLFNINESEKSRILNLHESATKRQYLTEQDSKYKEPMMPTEEDLNMFNDTSTSVDRMIQNIYRGDQEKLQQSIDRREDLITKFGDNYVRFLQAMSNLSASPTDMKMWFLNVSQEERVRFIQSFIEWSENGDRQVKKMAKESGLKTKSGKITANIEKGQLTRSKVKTPESEPVVNSQIFSLSGEKTFIDNKSDITPEVRVKIDSYVEYVKGVMEMNNGQYVCRKIDVAASSSRFRNTNEAKDLTWAELSKQRADKVYQELYGRLSEIGVKFTNNHKVLRGGKNGDGTSGPNPGENSEGVQYTISKDGTYDNTYGRGQLDSESINQFGSPLESKSQYDKYKFIIFEVDIIVETKDVNKPSSEVITGREYSVEFGVKWYQKGPRMNGGFKTPKGGSSTVNRKVKKVLDDCPIF